jgi:hypothetical protein
VGLFRNAGDAVSTPEGAIVAEPGPVGDRVAVLGGGVDLEVVGESYYQDNLWHLVGPHLAGQHVRRSVLAVLVPEPDGVSVRIDGLTVGYLSGNDAWLYRSGLLALQRQRGLPIALSGNIVAVGGMGADGPGMLGVFLSFDPADFGVSPASVLSVTGGAYPSIAARRSVV